MYAWQTEPFNSPKDKDKDCETQLLCGCCRLSICCLLDALVFPSKDRLTALVPSADWVPDANRLQQHAYLACQYDGQVLLLRMIHLQAPLEAGASILHSPESEQ